MLTKEATLFVDTFIRMARHVPANPTERNKGVMWVALNLYLDGIQGVSEGTHQGWTTASGEAAAEFLSPDSPFDTAVTPEAVLEQAVDIMGGLTTGGPYNCFGCGREILLHEGIITSADVTGNDQFTNESVLMCNICVPAGTQKGEVA